MAPIRVLVADDHTIVRQGIVNLLAASRECLVVAEAADGLGAVEKVMATRPEVLVLDISMPRLTGIEAVRRIRALVPSARILVLTVHGEEEYVLPVVRASASGYLVKDTAATELLAAMRALHAGHGYFGSQAGKMLAEELHAPRPGREDPYGTLTPREREVFHLVVEGCSTNDVARWLGVSVKTAENHRSGVMAKLGVHGTAELVRYAARKGLLS